jgi:sulfatase maturation enzyme AslB (radical SAM superfamily)
MVDMNIVERYKDSGLEYRESKYNKFGLPPLLFSTFDEEKFMKEYLSVWGERDDSTFINSSDLRDHQLDDMSSLMRPQSNCNLTCNYCYERPKPKLQPVTDDLRRNERFGYALYNPKAIAKMFGITP